LLKTAILIVDVAALQKDPLKWIAFVAVELFIDDQVDCEAFQSYACELLSIIYYMSEAFAL